MLARSLFPVDLRDIKFKQAPMRAYGSRGTPYVRWVPYGMPQLGQYKWIMDTVFFLYPTEGDAKAGTACGGTGFFVAVPSKRWPTEYFHIHGVTNWHVACDSGASIIRVNRNDSGAPELLHYDPSEWAFIGHGGPDIAISPPLPLDPQIHKASAIDVDDLILSASETLADIGAGEDIFMIGRFIDYDGHETNEPSFRFGNISILNAKIKQPTGFFGRSIVVDMHSRTGYSGSPVFIYRTPGSVFAPTIDLNTTWHYLQVAGILWGQFPERWTLADGEKSPKTSSAQAAIITDGKYVEGLSGMCCVIPAHDIVQLLGHPELEAKRETVERSIEPMMERRSLRPLPMFAGDAPGQSIEQQLEERMHRIASVRAMAGR
jgi:hypothetical protein